MDPSRYAAALKSLRDAKFIEIAGEAPEQLVLLSDSGAEVAREILARGHRAAALKSHRQEDLAIAQGMQSKAVFVVLGEAGGVENLAAAGSGEMFQGETRKAGAHAVGGQKSAQPLAHGDVLGLEFGELVAVEPMGRLAHGCRQGQHGDLDHGVVAREPVHQPERIGMHQVFGVVGHHDVVANAVKTLVFAHAVVDPVQTIALGRGAIVRAHHQVHAGVGARRLLHRARGGLVVGIDAHEYVVSRIANGGEVMFQHLADDAVLAPERHQDGDAAFGGVVELRAGRPGKRLVPGEQEGHADKQVVQSAHQDPESQRNETCQHQVGKPHGER